MSYYFSFIFSLFFLFFSLFSGQTLAQTAKQGILLVTFGSSYQQAEKAYELIDQKVKKAFPRTPVYWAYTSKKIRNKLAKEGKQIDSPPLALAKMLEQGFSEVVVQSLHVIPGEEFDYLKQIVNRFAHLPKGFKKISLGKPLLYSSKDVKEVVKKLYPVLPKLNKEEAFLFMGHGTEHPADVYYAGLNYWLQNKDKRLFLATVEGSIELEDILPDLRKNKIKRIYLMPFMSVAGDHAHNDLAGKEEDSWASTLTKLGFECVPYLKGLGEIESVVDIWVKHLQQAYKELDN